MALGKHEKAIADLTEVVRLEPDCANALVGLAYLYGARVRPRRRWRLWIERSASHRATGGRIITVRTSSPDLVRLGMAIADYTDAIRLNPRYAEAYYGRGYAYGKIGKTAEAEADFAQARELGYKP